MADRGSDRYAHLLGAAFVIVSAVIFSFSGTLTKMIESDAWTIACWRGLFGAIIVTMYVVWREEDPLPTLLSRLGWKGWLLATVGSGASILFIFSFKLTYVANVAIIYATVPFMAAGLEWLFLRQRFRQATLVAAAVSLAGVAIIVAGGLGSRNTFGDAVALTMTFGNALYMLLIRMFHRTPVVLAGGASAFQLFVIGWFVIDPLAVSFRDALLLALFGATFALAVILWTEGTRRIAAAESGLLGSAETPFAMLLAWLILAELPPVASFVGGSIVLAAVMTHALRDFLRRDAM